MRCLVLGATGHIGGVLVPALRLLGHEVVGAARTARPGTVAADAGSRADLLRVMSGVEVVYHLVHSLGDPGYAAVDAAAARNVAECAATTGVRQIVYLGGPSPEDGPVSGHLASRTEVADILLDAPVPALVLRAAMVVGAGSASFVLLGLSARGAPVVGRDGWMANRSRPIAVRDAVYHLARAADSAPVNAAVDIGGPETVSYRELVQRYARVAGLRWRPPVPGAAPAGAAPLAAAVTGYPLPMVRALLESLRHDLVPEAVLPPPPGGGTGLDQALREAMGLPTPSGPPADPDFSAVRRLPVDASPEALWLTLTDPHTLRSPGALWALRGALDHVLGGPGLYRHHPADLVPGATADAWTVVTRDEDARTLVLVADMRLPGRAWLTLSATEAEDGTTTLEQTVAYTAHGLPGRAYWHLAKPAHDAVFGAMARETARAAESRAHVS